MSGAAVFEPFELLQRLERLGLAHDAQAPGPQEVREEWAGIGFRMGGRRLLAPMGAVTEILTYPALSRVPHTKSWVRGIANVRGTLLPILDLGGFLGLGPSDLTRLSRVMVMDQAGVAAGLLVDEVLGLRDFPEGEWRSEVAESDERLRSFVAGGFQAEGVYWPIFSLLTLARDTRFLKVAD